MSFRKRTTRSDTRQQITKIFAGLGCVTGSFLLVVMALWFALELFKQVTGFDVVEEVAVFVAPSLMEGRNNEEVQETVVASTIPAPPTSAAESASNVSENVGADSAEFSPDSDAIASDEPNASTPRPRTDNIGGGGGLIAYTSNEEGNFDIFTSRIDGSAKQRLTTGWFGDWHPVWSPDGQQILFHTMRDGNWEIYSMNIDGSDQVNLTNSSADDSFAQWSGDGKRVIFHSNRDGDFDIYEMNVDGSDVQNISKTAYDEYGPDLSLDGTKIAFSRELSDGREIYVMDRDGSNVEKITNSVGSNFFPKWSGDGTQLLFHSNRDGNYEIYRIDADGSNLARVTNTDADDFFPVWSPDGKWILFHSNPTGSENGSRNIMMIRGDQLQEQTITELDSQQRLPSWQP